MRPGAEPDRNDAEHGTVWYWHTDHDTGRESDRFPGMYRAAILWLCDGTWSGSVFVDGGRDLPDGHDAVIAHGRLYVEGRIEAALMAAGYRVADDPHLERQRWGLPGPSPITDEAAAESGWRDAPLRPAPGWYQDTDGTVGQLGQFDPIACRYPFTPEGTAYRGVGHPDPRRYLGEADVGRLKPVRREVSNG